MGYYRGLREHIRALEAAGQLVRIRREVNKDTELNALVRWQFRGLPEAERKAFLFENVVDVKGRKYDIPVLVGAHAASRDIYATGMMCHPEKIMEKWAEAQLHPIEPKMVKSGPVHEEVHASDGLMEHGGLEEFPIPISTPGFDNAPYLTAANWVTKDPETGIRNVGNYRGQVKSPTRLGINCREGQHLRTHWEKCRERGIPLQVAIVIGPAPNVGFVSTVKIPYGIDEYTVAGGIAGEPVELVKCRTVDIEVPATAEIVLEGEMPPDYLEPEGPFGEHGGYMGMETINPYFNLTCVTHRKHPILNTFISQFPPSESSKLREIGKGAAYTNFVAHDCKIPGVLEVAIHEESGSAQWFVVRLKKRYPAQVWQALNAVFICDPMEAKIIIAVDEDIDPHDLDSVVWAIVYCVQPQRDIQVSIGKHASVDASAVPPEEFERGVHRHVTSSLLIDATRKWAYPPVSLPKREFMEKARRIWEEEGLPRLKPKVPWFGYSLGNWSKEQEEDAERALRGEHYATGERRAARRVKPG